MINSLWTELLTFVSVEVSPRSNMGITSGRTLSPSFLTRSPRVRAATFFLSELSLARQVRRREMRVGRISRSVRTVWVTTTFHTWRAACRTIRATSDLETGMENQMEMEMGH